MIWYDMIWYDMMEYNGATKRIHKTRQRGSWRHNVCGFNFQVWKLEMMGETSEYQGTTMHCITDNLSGMDGMEEISVIWIWGSSQAFMKKSWSPASIKYHGDEWKKSAAIQPEG